MRYKKINFPIELLSELINFIPFKSKWAKIRISKIFDFFVIKHQIQWIKFIKTLKTRVVTDLTRIVKILKYIENGEKSANLEPLSDFNKSFDGLKHVQSWQRISPLIQFDNFNWPIVNSKLKPDLQTGFKDKRTILAMIFNALLTFFTDVNINNITDWYLVNTMVQEKLLLFEDLYTYACKVMR
ncbi:hypothetical protein ACQ4LE_009102 [Meloidogyne hapla]